MRASLELALRRGLARLPGVAAQVRMAPQPRAGWDPHVVPQGLRPAAALLLVYPTTDGWCLPLTVRAGTLRQHTGQVSLPGGRVDTSESIEAAALREAEEEIGVAAEAVRVIGRLTALHIPVSGYLLHPVLAIADARPRFRAAPGEVAHLLEVAVDALRDPDAIGRERQTHDMNGRVVEVDVPFFAVGGERVWGATAMVLSEFLALIDDVLGSPAGSRAAEHDPRG
jgi:8-oxo-dGTP pyrophosphatase MutT (NUDIX family)